MSGRTVTDDSEPLALILAGDQIGSDLRVNLLRAPFDAAACSLLEKALPCSRLDIRAWLTPMRSARAP